MMKVEVLASRHSATPRRCIEAPAGGCTTPPWGARRSAANPAHHTSRVVGRCRRDCSRRVVDAARHRRGGASLPPPPGRSNSRWGDGVGIDASPMPQGTGGGLHHVPLGVRLRATPCPPHDNVRWGAPSRGAEYRSYTIHHKCTECTTNHRANSPSHTTTLHRSVITRTTHASQKGIQERSHEFNTWRFGAVTYEHKEHK